VKREIPLDFEAAVIVAYLTLIMQEWDWESSMIGRILGDKDDNRIPRFRRKVFYSASCSLPLFAELAGIAYSSG
jgi:hypothetical protein